MLISSRGRYALLVMIDLAGHRGGLVPGRQIAERLELSQKYLERILRTLAEAGLIEGSHGKGGGYRLLRSPADYTAGEICKICLSQKRDRSVICVVESPRDIKSIERTHEYNGLYHVLHGLISPMDGIGAEQLCIKELLARLNDTVKEVIMATSPTVEGEATAMYLAKLIKPMGIKTTRLAYGLPVGSSLEYADETTLYRAMQGRGEL